MGDGMKLSAATVALAVAAAFGSAAAEASDDAYGDVPHQPHAAASAHAPSNGIPTSGPRHDR